jgi:RNA polymerase sigma factor for flagellar operon FliA
VHKDQKRIARVTSSLVAQLDRDPTQTELANALGLDETELADFQAHSQPRHVVSLDEPTENHHGEENLPLTERLADPLAPRPDASILSTEDRRMMLQCLHCLPKTQLTVIVLHYLQNVPMRQVAKILAVTPSRISQLHSQALARLKQAWECRQDEKRVVSKLPGSSRRLDSPVAGG